MLLEARVPECAVGALLDDRISGEEVELGDELGRVGAVEDEVAVPPFEEHVGVVGGGFMAVASEDDGDGGAAAEADGGEEVGKDGGGHGGEVVLDVDDEEGAGFGVGVPRPDIVLLVGRGGRRRLLWNAGHRNQSCSSFLSFCSFTIRRGRVLRSIRRDLLLLNRSVGRSLSP